MTFITFIYKIGNRRFYGKYVFDYMSDDHEGLDDEIRPIVLKSINIYRQRKGLTPLTNLSLGVMSISVDGYIPCYSTKKERYVFDFYYEEFDKFDNKGVVYINGQKL